MTAYSSSFRLAARAVAGRAGGVALSLSVLLDASIVHASAPTPDSSAVTTDESAPRHVELPSTLEASTDDPTATPTNAEPSLLSADSSPSTTWDLLVDRPIVLELESGERVEARLVSHDATNLLLARSRDALLFTVPKQRVGRVFLASPAIAEPVVSKSPVKVPTKTGHAALIGGGIVLGGAVTYGIFTLAQCSNDYYCDTFWLLPAGAIAGGGVALLLTGAHLRRKHRRFHGTNATAMIMPTRGGVVASVSWRL